MQAFLEELFTSCLGSCSNLTGRKNVGAVLVGLVDWATKTAILDALWDKPNILLEGQELSSDFCPLTLKGRWEFKFLTEAG